MKSFTRSLANIQSKDIKSDKRLDSLIKQQMQEHQSIISSHHKEMQDLRENLNLCMERFESLFQKNDQDLKDFKTYAVCIIGVLQERIKSGQTMIADQKKTIDSLHDQLLTFNVIYQNKIEAEKIKNNLQNQIKEVSNNYLISFQNLQSEFKSLLKALNKDLSIFKNIMEKEIVQLNEKNESNFHLSKMDKNAVLKQVHVYEKSMFIIEKKIENIYTLIERINKRGLVCHKEE